MDIIGRRALPDLGVGTPTPHEGAQRLKNWLMILLGGIHYALQRIYAAEPLLDLVVFVAQELKTLRNLVADKEVARRFLLLFKLLPLCRELQIGEASAD